MKKLLFSAVVFCFVAMSFESKAQAFEEGNVVISAGYGIPLVQAKWLDAATTTASGATVDTYGHNPIYVKFEYGINDDWGIGLAYFNSSYGIKQTYVDNAYDANGNYIGTATYTDDISLNAQAFSFRLNRHIAVSDKFDMYWGFGGGPKFSKLTYKSTNPSYQSADIKLLPIAFELTYGARYYLTDNIGLYGEIGIARTYLQAGICAKF